MTHLQKTLSTLKFSRRGSKLGGRLPSGKICENNIHSLNDIIKITENINKTGNP
jgi:hypothetical protein